jgi:hypothetical protein
MAKHESVLKDEEKQSFVIKRFIFHIIHKDDLNPIYLDEIDLSTEQRNFFKQRFSDVSEGVQHIFTDKDNSTFYKDCVSLISNSDRDFIELSKKITASFKSHHKGTTNDGVFITSVVEVNGDRKLIFLLKLDHRKVYEYTVKDKKALLHLIEKTFVEDKRAIQKSALIDVSDYYGWDVLATDKSAKGRTALTGFFSKFLSVVERDTPSKLTVKAIGSIQPWIIENKNLRDPTQDVSAYRSRGIEYLKRTRTFKIWEFIDAVILDTDDDRRKKLRRSFKKYCDNIGLTGQSFTPNQNSITPKIKKNVRKTAEGVTIEWEGDAADSNIFIPPAPDPNDGFYHILIKASEIKNMDY